MDRRSFLTLLALPLVAELLAACGSDEAAPSAPGRATLRGTATRITSGADPAAAAAAVNAFSDDLYRRLVALDPAANLVVSPASIAIALAMTSAGARGATLDEMCDVLHVGDRAGIHRSMNGLAARLAAVNRSRDNAAEGGSGTSQVRLSVANSLWGQSGTEFEQAFLDLLSGEYGAGLEVVDYVADADAARRAINQWVADATADRITELIAEGVLTRDTRLTLVNAVYLKANWWNVFDPAATEPEPFVTAAGTPVEVQMMHQTDEMPYAQGEGWRAVDVPYVFGDLSLTVVVPDEGAHTPSPTVVAPALSTALVHLGLPRFGVRSSIQLGDVLQAMGMPTAFGQDADFSGITSEQQLVISDVVHQADITVDEEGTEAAAATAVVMVGTAAPSDQVTFTVDRPFTFWLRERSTGVVLFAGRVNDPTA